MSKFRVLAAGLALVAHTFAIGALCFCPSEAMAGGITAERAEMSCHESAPELSMSSPEDCCCDSNPGEGTPGLVAKRALDEVSLSTQKPWAMSVPLTPVMRTLSSSTSPRGAMPPRPPLRV